MSEILSQASLNELISLRKTLHQHPELSGQENNTAQLLLNFLKKLKPDAIFSNLAGNGIAAVFDSGKPGPVVLLRSDMDALPIQEVNTFYYRSTQNGVAHKCGHDGHMAIMSGVAMLLAAERPSTGKVVLLYQPEEETGKGAEKILGEKVFSVLRPDWAFALHNLPEFEENLVIIKDGPFAAASKGMIIKLEGSSSHAAHPEQGNSPVKVMTGLITRLMNLPAETNTYKDFTLLTIIHARLGEIAFGTNPGKAEVMATLRTFYDKDMEVLTQKAEDLVKELAEAGKIRYNICYTETFPATNNNTDGAQIVYNAAKEAGNNVQIIKEPFRWSEDFGHFTGKYPGALFGLGAGEKQPGLHNNDYDFPDQILYSGILVFQKIIDQILNKKNSKDV